MSFSASVSKSLTSKVTAQSFDRVTPDLNAFGVGNTGRGEPVRGSQMQYRTGGNRNVRLSDGPRNQQILPASAIVNQRNGVEGSYGVNVGTYTSEINQNTTVNMDGNRYLSTLYAQPQPPVQVQKVAAPTGLKGAKEGYSYCTARDGGSCDTMNTMTF
jgi:hypothetical protein